MARLVLSLFGQLRVCRDGVNLAGLAEHRAGHLLALLVLRRGMPQARETLAELLWPDLDPVVGRKRLRTTIWRLRGVLEPVDGARYLVTTRASIAFNPASDYWLDVEAFETLTEPRPAETPTDRIDRLRQAAALYRGDLLEDVYEDWCAFERGRLQKLFQRVLGELVRQCASLGQYDEAIHWGELLLKHDPTQEDVHRELMRLHLAAGRRAAALRQYFVCRRALEQEVGVEPMPETQVLYEQIQRGARSPGGETSQPAVHSPDGASHIDADPALPVMPVVLQRVLHQIERAASDLREALGQLEQAVPKLARRRPPLANPKQPASEKQPTLH